jgi:transcriptional regulator NrdR family protein
VPELTVVDGRRTRRTAKFDPEKLRRSFTEPIRKVPATGFLEPNRAQLIPDALMPLASEYLFDFIVEELARAVPEPNGEVTTDFVATIVLRGLHRMNVIAFLRSAVHHRMMTSAARESEIDDLAGRADVLVSLAHAHTQGGDVSWPALREPPSAIVCPRCGTTRIARRSRSNAVRGLDQQPASCSHCGQRYVMEWGSQAPLLVSSAQGDSLFDIARFRAGIRSAVRKLPGTAAIWGDEKLVVSAANTAAVAAIPFIQPPTTQRPIPSINSGDLWLAAAAALRGIHPLAFVRYAVHSGAIDDLDWNDAVAKGALTRMEETVVSIGRRYFDSPAFPE